MSKGGINIMKQDRQILEDILNLVIEDYSNDNQIQEQVIGKLLERGIPRGRTTGIFTKAIPLVYVEEIELCLFTKYLYGYTHRTEINPDEFFTEIELSSADYYKKLDKEKVKYILLHNVDQIDDSQWLCTKETYQNINLYMGNGLLTYNPNTQRQLLKRRSGNRIVESINIDSKKVSEITESMIDGSFCTNAIMWNIRKINGQEKFKYDLKTRTLLIEPDNASTLVDIIDGANRTCGMLKTVEIKNDIDRVTSIYIHHVTEERANEIIRQESKSTQIETEWVDFKNTANPNMEVAKAINSRQRANEMFNRIALNEKELIIENKLMTFDTLSKSIEFLYDLKEEPVIRTAQVENDIVELFNNIIGLNYSKFKTELSNTKENSYLAHNNMFMGYIILGDLLRQEYGDDWKPRLVKVLNSLDFDKSNKIWKKIGIENHVNLSTFKKISDYFKDVVYQLQKEVS